MRFTLNKNNIRLNTPTLLKKCGYHYTGMFRGEPGFARRAGRSRYPQFHIYVNEESQDKLVLNLHLDAKKASYAGSKMHAGEYDTEVVKQEIQRIDDIINNLS
ncbi:MAG: hypothetical protein U5L76_05755 [Patescibacteria group bacterium]|nr:hypothetical protein [Patescibacteria group bacterium]MDZ7799071.1 hypothetical protein [Patescibacteria group bacterium]